MFFSIKKNPRGFKKIIMQMYLNQSIYSIYIRKKKFKIIYWMNSRFVMKCSKCVISSFHIILWDLA